ncbi:hypothetical protein CHCC20335_3836 [Bacillus paralicheniformis]|nr:hypothetical protein CHCC20335_3836 [Bacillus paralicheniformis]
MEFMSIILTVTMKNIEDASVTMPIVLKTNDFQCFLINIRL